MTAKSYPNGYKLSFFKHDFTNFTCCGKLMWGRFGEELTNDILYITANIFSFFGQGPAGSSELFRQCFNLQFENEDSFQGFGQDGWTMWTTSRGLYSSSFDSNIKGSTQVSVLYLLVIVFINEQRKPAYVMYRLPLKQKVQFLLPLFFIRMVKISRHG